MREMRRSRQLLSQEDCETILKDNTSGVLSVYGEDGYPYGVPLSYVYADGKLYFHSAQTGHKIDAVRKNNKASFTIIAQDNIVPEEYTTYFRSVIVFGRVRILENDAEKRAAIETLAEKYMPDLKEGRLQEIEKEFSRLCMLELTIDHMTGKEAIELVRARQ
ncbi:MAG: pyridoxamine 5'-phosphate oxidase family protein [Peptococcaceae bacterium]|nr:pyridoxamine 5'-phosphate oxidase family protein [Peptococcaceae bacterium]